jgi:ketosteroid isomerase-like protein
MDGELRLEALEVWSMLRFLAVAVLGAGICTAAVAQSTAKDEASIRAGMNAQVEAWNRADIPGFMRAYEDSAETTFIGTTLRKGYEPILKRYQENYTSRAQMGVLTYSDLDIRFLPSACGKTEIALVTGKFHLEREQRGQAKKDDGVFSLVWRKGRGGWKIVLDHTS